MNLHPVFKRVDTCAAEFEANTPYLYSSYEDEDEVRPDDRKKVLILGSGPNRIGQGIEFDYCCVQASFALRAAGYETLMVNCNPETVSTDYDTSDRLYFEPLTLEDVLEVARREKPIGAIVQFGGQTPLKLARGLEKAGIRILGTSVDAIDAAEDRELWSRVVEELKLRQPENGIARSAEQALATARRIGYPVMVRPSFVLGGRAMEVVHDDAGLIQYSTEAVQASEERPILIDRFLNDATDVDVDCVGDGKDYLIAGEVVGVDDSFPRAFAKAQIAAGNALPMRGRVFISVRDADKPGAAELGARLVKLGFEIVATAGTAELFRSRGVPCQTVLKVAEG